MAVERRLAAPPPKRPDDRVDLMNKRISEAWLALALIAGASFVASFAASLLGAIAARLVFG
jgi:hypothetical protein